MVGKSEENNNKKEEPQKETISKEKPLIIEPEEDKPGKEKPRMPELKGEPGKKLERAKRQKKAGPLRKQGKFAVIVTVLSFLLLAFGLSIVVLPMYGMALPPAAEPVIDFCRGLPIFPEKATGVKKTAEAEITEEAPAESSAPEEEQE